jgi:hypothetical protein
MSEEKLLSYDAKDFHPSTVAVFDQIEQRLRAFESSLVELLAGKEKPADPAPAPGEPTK